MTDFGKDTPIGFIGLGVMGSAMARRLVDAGYSVTLHSRTIARAEALEGAVAASPLEVARRSRLVFLSLPETAHVEAVLFGEQGLAGGLQPGARVVDTSTISASATRDFARRLGEIGVDMLDAPVSGGRQGAEDGKLTCMVGGPEPVFEACRVPCSVLAARYLRMGDHGAGQIAKCCNQIAVANALIGVSEAFALGRKQGLDLPELREALLGGAARSFVLEKHGQRMIDLDFAPGFTAALMRKDLDLATQAGHDADAFLQGTRGALRLLEILCGEGSGDLDWSALGALVASLPDTPIEDRERMQ